MGSALRRPKRELGGALKGASKRSSPPFQPVPNSHHLPFHPPP